MNPKIKSRSELHRFIQKIKRQKKKVVFTNGCFDILHAGHVTYLRKARKAGDFLVVGLNTDASVRAIKGPSRPVNHEKDRAEVMSALEFVDCVTFFGEETPLKLIQAVKPDILVKGGDWSLAQIVGRDFVESYGGKVKRIPLLPGRSTTNTLKKLVDG